MIQIGKTTDFLKTKPIREMSKAHGEDAVKGTITKAVIKCAMCLGIDMPFNLAVTLSEDIMDVYPYDSVESVLTALKNGRQGMYGFGMNNRKTLNMVLIRDWMEKTLDEIAKARQEEQNEKFKKNEANEEILSREELYNKFRIGLERKKQIDKDRMQKEQEEKRVRTEWYLKRKKR